MLGITFRDPVEALMGSVVATVPPTATLRKAANLLAADSVGLLVAVDARGVRGVLSERDIVFAVTEQADLDQARVKDYASTDLVSVEEDTTIFDAAIAMAGSDVRHLVVTRRGEPTGVISMRDIVAVLVEQAEFATMA